EIAGVHKRTATTAAHLEIGLRHFLRFAQEVEALTELEARRLRSEASRVLHEAAQHKGSHQLDADPARRFLELIRSAILSGRAYVADARTGEEPENHTLWGWREEPAGERLRFILQGRRVGWLDGSDLYLDSTAAFAAAQQLGRETEEPLS